MLELKVYSKGSTVTLPFEHSLLSLSKWESKFKRPFLVDQPKLPTEMIDYFQMMLMSPEVDPDLVYLLQPEQLDELTTYIGDNLSASSVPDDPNRRRGRAETVTTELIYYWLSALKIPFHPTETWHISRTMMLVRIAEHKQQGPKKRNPAEAMASWREMNARNKERFNSAG